jgi:hypothetical protein
MWMATSTLAVYKNVDRQNIVVDLSATKAIMDSVVDMTKMPLAEDGWPAELKGEWSAQTKAELDALKGKEIPVGPASSSSSSSSSSPPVSTGVRQDGVPTHLEKPRPKRATPRCLEGGGRFLKVGDDSCYVPTCIERDVKVGRMCSVCRANHVNGKQDKNIEGKTSEKEQALALKALLAEEKKQAKKELAKIKRQEKKDSEKKKKEEEDADKLSDHEYYEDEKECRINTNCGSCTRVDKIYGDCLQMLFHCEENTGKKMHEWLWCESCDKKHASNFRFLTKLDEKANPDLVLDKNPNCEYHDTEELPYPMNLFCYGIYQDCHDDWPWNSCPSCTEYWTDKNIKKLDKDEEATDDETKTNKKKEEGYTSQVESDGDGETEADKKEKELEKKHAYCEVFDDQDCHDHAMMEMGWDYCPGCTKHFKKEEEKKELSLPAAQPPVVITTDKKEASDKAVITAPLFEVIRSEIEKHYPFVPEPQSLSPPLPFDSEFAEVKTGAPGPIFPKEVDPLDPYPHLQKDITITPSLPEKPKPKPLFSISLIDTDTGKIVSMDPDKFFDTMPPPPPQKPNTRGKKRKAEGAPPKSRKGKGKKKARTDYNGFPVNS